MQEVAFMAAICVCKVDGCRRFRFLVVATTQAILTAMLREIDLAFQNQIFLFCF